MSNYTFTSFDAKSTSVITHEIKTVVWTDLADTFYDFLRGCGFVLERQDLSDHFDQSMYVTVGLESPDQDEI